MSDHHRMRGQGHGYGPPAYGAPAVPGDVARVGEAFGRGAVLGATVGAMVGASGAADPTAPIAPQARRIAGAALGDATRVAMAAGVGAAVASMVPAGGLARSLTMIAVGAAVLSVTDREREAKGERG